MPRTLDPAAYTVKREAFIDAAMGLMQSKGYEQMSIQDVLDAAGASRGAFYHYFDSKQALLEAIVDRIADQALAGLAPVVDDAELPAVAKLERFFGGIAQYKTDRKALMLEFIKVWKSDDMAAVRDNLRRTMIEKIAPILARIVSQGVAEEVFSVEGAADTASILMAMLLGFQDRATDLFLARQAGTVSPAQAQRALESFRSAFERILGARPGSIHMVDQRTLDEWFG
jgi:AcrR family transcriptional regulator